MKKKTIILILGILVILAVAIAVSCKPPAEEEAAEVVEEAVEEATVEEAVEEEAEEVAAEEEAVEMEVPENAVVSVKVDTAPAIDGEIDDVWAQATAIDIPVSDGANTDSATMTLKSIYTDDEVFFLAEWDNPEDSKQRMPWQKQDDGLWAKLTSSDDHDENVYYEDKLAMIWNINDSIEGFNDKGCTITCHAGDADKAYGNKYTKNEGELGDIWHWKRVRTDPVGQVDDQYLDSARYSLENTGAGRHGDPKDGGGYTNNQTEDSTGPAFTSDNQPANQSGEYWIMDSDKQEFADTYEAGDEVAGIIISPFLGDRGDIMGKGEYADGKWTLEIGRKLDTGSEFDVQFTDFTKSYFFGTALFDNAQVRHAYSDGVYQLIFK